MLHAGVDMHKRYSVITFVDDEGKGLFKGAKLPNNEREILAFFKDPEEENGERVRVVSRRGQTGCGCATRASRGTGQALKW